MRARTVCFFTLSVACLFAQSEKRRIVPSYDARFSSGVQPDASRVVEAMRGKKSGGQRTASSAGAREYLIEDRGRLGLNADVVGQLKLLRESGRQVDFQQTIGGMPVFEGHIKVAFDESGEAVSVTLPGWMPHRLNRMMASLTPEDAVRRAFKTLRIDAPGEFRGSGDRFENPLGEGYDPIEVELVAFPVDASSALLSWHIRVDGGRGRRAEMVIDAANGRLLFCHSLERNAGSGRVWRSAPDKGDRVVVNFPESWLPGGQSSTTGNNADAYLDTDGNDAPDNLPDPGIQSGRAFATNQTFDFPAPDPNGQDDPRKFRAAAVTNAFYFANTAHDFFYGLGFDEAAGNFQRDNAGKGGVAGDPVRVEVQDRFETDNASMTLTRDGISPRLQVGIYTRGTQAFADDRDLAYDGQTFLHEYTHGVTNRNVGGGTSTSCLTGDQSGALDEGWADYFASSFFNEPLQSAFFANGTRGIRRRSYEGYPFTYEDLGNDGFEEHRDGEIWAAALWDLRKALGQPVTDKLVYTALRATPCRPSFIAARDAILAADAGLNGGANRARIWQAFGQHGMGSSASGLDGGAGAATVFNAAFDLPADLQSGNNRGPAVTSQPPSIVAGGQLFTYQIQAVDPEGDALKYELSQGPAGMTVDGATGLVRWIAGSLRGRAKILITDGKGGRVIHGFKVEVITALRPGQAVTMAVPTRFDSALVSIDVPPATPVLQLASRGGTGDVDLSMIGPQGELEIPFDWRSDQFETLSVGNPSAGRWIGLIFAYRAFEGALVTATLPVPRLIKGNDSLLGLSGEPSTETFYRVAVPPGANALTIRTTGGSGDVDVFVQRQTPPVCQSFEDSLSSRCFFSAFSANFRNNEIVQLTTPQAGNWYINLSSASGYGSVAMTTEMNVRPTLVVDPAAAIVFNAVEGGPAPPSQVLKLSDPSGTKFDWTATVNPAAAWLKLSADKGSGDSDVTLTATATGLAPGSYRTSVTIVGSGLGQSPQTVSVTLVTSRPATISASAQQLNFTSAAGTNPPPQTLEFSNSGGGAFEWSVTASGGDWLSVDQPRGTGKAQLQVIVRAGMLAPGAYDGTLTIAAVGAPSVAVRVRYIVTLALSLSDDSLRSLSSLLPGRAVSPGDLMVVQGLNLIANCSTVAGASNPCPVVTSYPLSTELGGLQIRVNDVAAPLVSVTATEVRFLIPFEASGPEARIVASRGGGVTPAIVRALETQSIGVFTALENGVGAGKMFHADGGPVSRAAPLAREETITIQAGGLGAVSPNVASGAAAPADPLAQTVIPIQVYFDGAEGAVQAAYLEPGAAGFYRVKVTVPARLPRKFPTVQMQSTVSQSQEVSAGGPTLVAEATPASLAKGSGDTDVTLRGINLPAGAAVKIGEETFPGGELTAGGALQTLRVTIPARLLAEAGELVLRVIDPAAPEEAPSNATVIRVR